MIENPETTLMFAEAAEAAEAVDRQRTRNAPALSALTQSLRAAPPRAVATLARGSSDNAATLARYLIETQLRLLTTSVAPSVSSVYDSPPDYAGALMIAISQSGRSPDLIAAADHARSGGAQLVSLVNDETSPLATDAEVLLPLCAGPERSVAATKSYITSVAGILELIAAWGEDRALSAALNGLPELLAKAWTLDWGAALEPLRNARSMFVVARGPAFGVAQEMALKIKETCGFHAEAFSAAEVRHGPMAIVENGFPVLLLGQDDESNESVAALAPMFAERGATVIGAGVGEVSGITLPTLNTHPMLQPVLAVQSFYRLANALSVARGRDPDSPPHLAKVTRTL